MGSPSKQDGPLPPGMVIGPDGKPCRVCSSGAAFRAWRPPTAATKTATATATAAVPVTPPPPADCPPDVEQLGRATWTFLHVTAAYYPDRPTPNQRANMLTLLRALPVLYPCFYCADDFGKEIQAHPPDVSSRAGLSRWLCERHNEVNLKLGKPKFDCSLEKTDERWKDGVCD
ncbi:FAD-dependent thiol oxidase [Armillaria borealis]|uniref:Sulfhydryl oxidase n=1 Tax=Armillaria borealis TaxID=47425 RepID=A0AA39IYL1_9AGAR|nr:FAD-dependent thiol oxidase [Armillaria borealis]